MSPTSPSGVFHMTVNSCLVCLLLCVQLSALLVQLVPRVLAGKSEKYPTGSAVPFLRACTKNPWKSAPLICTEIL